MVELIDNGRVIAYKPPSNIIADYASDNKSSSKISEERVEMEEEIDPNNLQFRCSSWQQFKVLFRRASKQIYNDKVKVINISLLTSIFQLQSFCRITFHFEFPCTFSLVS
jgi:hypothetical protein